jgi:hypothetical protein
MEKNLSRIELLIDVVAAEIKYREAPNHLTNSLPFTFWGKNNIFLMNVITMK